MFTMAIDRPREHRSVWEARHSEALPWCAERFDPPGFIMYFARTVYISGGARWGWAGPLFYFHHEAHAIEFKMRWG